MSSQLKEFHKVLSPGDPGCLSEDEEQKSSREALLKISVDFLRMMDEEDLADCLQSSKIHHDGTWTNVSGDEDTFLHLLL